MADDLGRIVIVRGDITKLDVDVIVNAANSSLMGGGGVDGAIHCAGGPTIMEECREIIARQGICPPGEAVITTGGRLVAKFVIHTVGPVWNGGLDGEPEELASCYKNSLSLARQNNLRTIAFPNISTGVYGYPKKDAARIAIQATSEFLLTDQVITKIYFVCFDHENFRLYRLLVNP